MNSISKRKAWPLALALLALSLSSCATDPQGRKHWVGPAIKITAGYNAASLSFTLFSDLASVEPPAIPGPITLPPSIYGVPISTK